MVGSRLSTGVQFSLLVVGLGTGKSQGSSRHDRVPMLFLEMLHLYSNLGRHKGKRAEEPRQSQRSGATMTLDLLLPGTVKNPVVYAT